MRMCNLPRLRGTNLFAFRPAMPTDMELAMLEFNENTQSNSRLSCQIEINDELDGLRVTLPESQY